MNNIIKILLKISVKLLLPIVILLCGGFYTAHLLKTSPEVKRKPQTKEPKLVEVVSVDRCDVPVIVKAMGTVIAAREVELKPQVSGKVIDVSSSLMPGGYFSSGDILIRIEPDDYELIVEQKKSDVAKAMSNLKLEHGYQAVAKQEYELLENEIAEQDKDLVLRKPQLTTAQSSLSIAESQLRKAELDLERTNVRSPFNAMVKTKNVELGGMVNESSVVATLAGTDEYWIEVMIPVDKLKWIEFPNVNSPARSQVRIYNQSAWDNNVYRNGEVLKLLPDIEEKGRMAKILVSVKDPLCLNCDENENNILLLDSYVRVEIMGKTIKSALALDRALIRNNNTIWIMNEKNELEIKPIKIIYRGEEQVIVSNGIENNNKIIITNLSTPVEGMDLRVAGDTKKNEENNASLPKHSEISGDELK